MVCILVWLCSFAAARQVWAQPQVKVSSELGCVDALAVQQALQTAQVRHLQRGSDRLSVDVQLSELADGRLAAQLMVRRPGQLPWSRLLTVDPWECPELPEVLGLVLDRYLSELPSQRSVPVPALSRRAVQAGRLVAAPESRRLSQLWAGRVAVLVAPSTAVAGSASAAGAVVRGAHRVGGVVTGRVTSRRSLGRGSYGELALLAGPEWGVRLGVWEAGLSARAGGVRYDGRGFHATESVWLPWLELTASLSRRWGPGGIGVLAVIAPLRHEVVIADRSSVANTPVVRVGLVVSFGLGDGSP